MVLNSLEHIGVGPSLSLYPFGDHLIEMLQVIDKHTHTHIHIQTHIHIRRQQGRRREGYGICHEENHILL